MIYFRKNWGGILNRQTVFCKKESIRKRAGGIQRRKEKSTHMQKREERRDEGDLRVFFWRIWERQGRGGKKKRIFFRGEGLKRGGRRLREREKRALGEFLVDFLNEIQKKIVDMEITFPGGTSRGRIGWFRDSLWWRNTRARSKKQTQLDWEEKVTQSC